MSLLIRKQLIKFTCKTKNKVERQDLKKKFFSIIKIRKKKKRKDRRSWSMVCRESTKQTCIYIGPGESTTPASRYPPPDKTCKYEPRTYSSLAFNSFSGNLIFMLICDK